MSNFEYFGTDGSLWHVHGTHKTIIEFTRFEAVSLVDGDLDSYSEENPSFESLTQNVADEANEQIIVSGQEIRIQNSCHNF